MTIRLSTVVLDAEDVESVSAFWAGLLGGTVERTAATWHAIRVAGEPAPGLAVQGVSGHRPPQWPDGAPQQVHLDFEVDDIAVAHATAVRLGARVLRPAEGPRLDAPIGFQVYADPAGHPFCLCWGQQLAGELDLGNDTFPLDVDGETFEVLVDRTQAGSYHLTWLTGPNPGYGFSFGRSDHSEPSRAELTEYARGFLADIDPATGFWPD